MQTVSVYDELTVEVGKRLLPGIKLSISGDFKVPEDGSNLVCRAAEAFFAATGCEIPLSVSLIKRIPTEAGLGGGSADAAAMLRALNRLFDSPLSDERLLSIASKIGADVAFCLFGGTAICSGIGDRMTQVSDPALRHYVIIKGDASVSTPAAYRALDAIRGDSVPAFPDVSLHYDAARGNDARLYNDFESAVFPDHPSVSELKNKLLGLGASAALMTGSGAAVFGIFPDQASAGFALQKVGVPGFVAETVGRYPYMRKGETV